MVSHHDPSELLISMITPGCTHSLPPVPPWTFSRFQSRYRHLCCPPPTVLHTSSTNYTKALTKTMGEAALTSKPNNDARPSHYNPDSHHQMLDAQRLSCRTCNQPLAACNPLGDSFSLYCAVWSSKPHVSLSLCEHVRSFKTTDVVSLRHEWMKC